MKYEKASKMADHQENLTICAQTGFILSKTRDGVMAPADYSFSAVNHFVHSHEVTFEELQYACLGMASEIERLRIEAQQQKERANALSALIANDGHAITFQSMGSYRAALLDAFGPNAELTGAASAASSERSERG